METDFVPHLVTPKKSLYANWEYNVGCAWQGVTGIGLYAGPKGVQGRVNSTHQFLQDYGTTPHLKKTVQICFCQNFVKFPPILIIFGKKMAKML